MGLTYLGVGLLMALSLLVPGQRGDCCLELLMKETWFASCLIVDRYRPGSPGSKGRITPSLLVGTEFRDRVFQTGCARSTGRLFIHDTRVLCLSR